MFVLDSHCDTPSQILRLRDLSLDNEYAHVDFPKLRRGGVDGAFFALYVPAEYDSDPEAGFSYAMKLFEGVEECVRSNSHLAAFARSASEAYANKDKGLFSVFLGLENASPIGESLERIRYFHDKGIRYMTLCHSGHNQICDSCAPEEGRWGGLSPFGKEVVAEMNRLGMPVDVSHVSDETFYDVLEYSDRPVVATHSCCRALAGHPRNMTDDMIKALAASGGVIQINFYPLFLDGSFKDIDDPVRPSYKRIVDHMEHVVNLVGIDHVGIGSDFDGIEVTPEGLEDISMMPKVFDELRGRGYSETDIEKIAGLNFFRCMQQQSFR